MTRLPLAIDPAHPAFEGHFPSMPIVPGVVLLDLALRAIAAHRATTMPTAGAERCRLGAAKFLSFVRPGESLALEIEASAMTDAAFSLRIFAGPIDHRRLALNANVAFEGLAVATVAATMTD